MRILIFITLLLNLANGYSFNNQKIFGTWISKNGVVFEFFKNNKINTNIDLATIDYDISGKRLKIMLDKTLFLYDKINNPNSTKKNKLKYKIKKVTEDTLELLSLNEISSKILFNEKRTSLIYFKKIDKVAFKPSNYDSLSFSFICNATGKIINNKLTIKPNGDVNINDSIKFVTEIQSSLNEKMNNKFDNLFQNVYNKYYFIYENSNIIITNIYVKNLRYRMICDITSCPKSMILFIKNILSQIPPLTHLKNECALYLF